MVRRMTVHQIGRAQFNQALRKAAMHLLHFDSPVAAPVNRDHDQIAGPALSGDQRRYLMHAGFF